MLVSALFGGLRDFVDGELLVNERDALDGHLSHGQSTSFIGTQTDIQPKVSMVARFLTRAWCFAIRLVMVVSERATQTGRP